jgi:antitoxin component YwqK of YwqJK toxin-antitoxin module
MKLKKERFTGTLLTFYPNGMILESTDYRDGMRCGEHKRFYKDGVLMWRGWY